MAFDGNYRPTLWPVPESALAARDRGLAVATLGLPTFDDEAALGAATPAAAAAYWRKHGVDEVIVKLGAGGCLVGDGVVAPQQIAKPVDTSGAGDAFNAGYLNARLVGLPTIEAARQGHALAGWTVMRRGAIPSRDAQAPY